MMNTSSRYHNDKQTALKIVATGKGAGGVLSVPEVTVRNSIDETPKVDAFGGIAIS